MRETPAERVFPLLALCAQRPGHPQIAAQLPAALAVLHSDAELVEQAVAHGLAPLLLAHIRAAKAVVAPSVSVRLYAQHTLQARTAVVRRRVVGDAVNALASVNLPVLVLKGAALAPLVYDTAAYRPMRDVDLLIRRADARRAFETLRQLGFTQGERTTAPDHHHLPAMLKTEESTTIVIELHHQWLRRTPFVAPLGYDDLRPRAQPFEWSGLGLWTLGREDMLWHVYAHAFVVNTLTPGIALVSLADLVHATEAWADLLDWDLLRRQYGRLMRALPLVQQVTPWSAHVADILRVHPFSPVSGLRSMSSSLHWSGIATRDVVWPPVWWFRMRYGVDGPWRWLWYRGAGHPLRVALSAARSAWRRIASHRGGRPHPLLDDGLLAPAPKTR